MVLPRPYITAFLQLMDQRMIVFQGLVFEEDLDLIVKTDAMDDMRTLIDCKRTRCSFIINSFSSKPCLIFHTRKAQSPSGVVTVSERVLGI